MPGVPALAAEMGVDRKTVAFALAQLEAEGLLVGQGAGRRRRIVMLESGATLSTPGPDGAAFLDEMAAHGIGTGDYNLPGWEGGFDGLYRCLESLFAHTPPTAMFLYSVEEYFATAQFLLHRGLRVPQDVSLICCYMAPYFRRYQPSISHVRWNDQLMVNRIARWANNISHGKEDIRQTKIDAEFVEAGTVGRA